MVQMRTAAAAIAVAVMAGAGVAPAAAADGVTVDVAAGSSFSAKYRTTVSVADGALDGWRAVIQLRRGGHREEMKPDGARMLVPGKWQGRVIVDLPTTESVSGWWSNECDFTVTGVTPWAPYDNPEDRLQYRSRTVTGDVTCSDEVLGTTVTYGKTGSYREVQYSSTFNVEWVADPGSNETWGYLLDPGSPRLSRLTAAPRVDRAFRFVVKPRNSPLVSLGEAKAIRLGMTFAQVFRIVGSYGHQEVKASGLQVRSYPTSYQDLSMVLGFTGGRVASIQR